MIEQETANKLIEHLREIPIVDQACRKAGVSRATYYRWRKEDIEFKRLLDNAIMEGREHINEMCDSQLMTMIKEKNIQAIKHWQVHNDPTYWSKDVATRRAKQNSKWSWKFKVLDLLKIVKLERMAKEENEKLDEKNFDKYWEKDAEKQNNMDNSDEDEVDHIPR